MTSYDLSFKVIRFLNAKRMVMSVLKLLYKIIKLWFFFSSSYSHYRKQKHSSFSKYLNKIVDSIILFRIAEKKSSNSAGERNKGGKGGKING